MTMHLTGGRVWFNDREITPCLRTGTQPLAVVDGQVVFAHSGTPWWPGPTGIRIEDDWGDHPPLQETYFGSGIYE